MLVTRQQKSQQELEAILSDAIDLLRRGLAPEARGQLKIAIEEYEIFYNHLYDARIALKFNFFLACLDQHDAPSYEEVLKDLLTLFKQLPEPSTTSLEVSRQLSLLLNHSSLKVDIDLKKELLALLARDFLPPLNLRDSRFLLEAHIRPSTIAQLTPIDSGLLCYTLAKQSMSIVTLPGWMRKIYRSQVKTPQFPDEVEESLNLFANFFLEGIYDEAYQALLHAFEWAVYCAPVFAFEWVIGLVLLEGFKDVENLAFNPSLPLERRVTLTIKMHKDFANLLADERDAERLALHHWQEVISLSQFHLQVIQHRQKERSTHRSEDMETQGWLRVRMAEGLIAQGDDLQAKNILDLVSSKARIDTYRDPILSATSLSLSGMINERSNYLEDASTDYYNALNRAIPCPVLSYEDVLFLERWTLERGNDHQRLTQMIIGIKRSCDLIRLTNHSEALSDLDLLSLLLNNLGHALPYEAYLETVIYLGLTYAYLDDHSGAKRALEAAQALDHISGIALSNLFLLRAWKKELALQSEHPAKLRPQYDRVLKEIEGARGGEVQRQLQLHSTLLFLQVNLPKYHAMIKDQREKFGKKAEALLKKTYESFCQQTLRSHLCQLSLLLPKISHEELEGQIQALLHLPECQMAARWLVKVLKEDDHPYYFVSPKKELAHLIKEEHGQRFEQQWVQKLEVQRDSFKIYDQLISRKDTPAWPQRSLNPQEARLEYFIFDEWFVVYLITKDHKIMTHQSALNKEELEQDVRELVDYLTALDEPQYLLNEVSQRLYQFLLEPFHEQLNHLHRLIISPSDILSLLPFSVLLDREGRYLGEKLELAISLSTASPVFSNTTMPRGPVQLCHVEAYNEIVSDIANTLANIHDPQKSQSFSLQDPLSWLKDSLSLGDKYQQFKASSIVTLNAEVNQNGSLYFSSQTHQDELTLSEIVRALVYNNTTSCILTRSISPFIVPHRSIKTLLTSVHGGVIHCRWQGGYFDIMMERVISRLFEGSLLVGMMGALTHLRRTAIQEKHHPREWACFELYVAQHQLE